MIKSNVLRVTDVFDRFAHWWESPAGQRVIGNALVLLYLITLGVVELNRQGILPSPLSEIVPLSHFAAVDLAFSLLLFFEVIGLVLGLTRSVSRAAGKQFEVFSLILIRESFKTFTDLQEPLNWENILATDAIYKISAEATGALLIFVVLGFYYRAQRHRRITGDDQEQASFIVAKKLIATGLLLVFAGIGVVTLFETTIQGTEGRFFERFFTVLVFSDILIVLISLRYSASYHVAFRNVGFAIATVFIRLALIAPIYIDAIIGVGAALFSLGITFAYNRFAPTIEREEKMAREADMEVRKTFEETINASD